MIIMHIVSYLFLIVVNALQFFDLGRGVRPYEISTICELAVTFFCTVIFGLIVNQIVTKILEAKISSS